MILGRLVLEILAQIPVAAGDLDVAGILLQLLFDEHAVALLARVEAAPRSHLVVDWRNRRGWHLHRGREMRIGLSYKLLDIALLQRLPRPLDGAYALEERPALDIRHAIHLPLKPVLVSEQPGNLMLQAEVLAHNLEFEREQSLRSHHRARKYLPHLGVFLVFAHPQQERKRNVDLRKLATDLLHKLF
ncbi:MAG: hypothetical protein BWY35_02417 [Firmicutes bacterium ADurb.Bin248]|nr:MAG: hypothetical protein BWY35_02417 [Firmicutes bacterium ADurb.Bin248]